MTIIVDNFQNSCISTHKISNNLRQIILYLQMFKRVNPVLLGFFSFQISFRTFAKGSETIFHVQYYLLAISFRAFFTLILWFLRFKYFKSHKLYQNELYWVYLLCHRRYLPYQRCQKWSKKKIWFEFSPTNS